MNVSTFNCVRGSETLAFQAVSITQNNSIALQLVNSTRVVHIVHVTVNGQVVSTSRDSRGGPTSGLHLFYGPLVLDVFLSSRGSESAFQAPQHAPRHRDPMQ